jgi:hypothetical protein
MSFYDDASWLLIPSGIKEDVVFAQKPTSGLGDLTFTRASDATYTDSTGVVRRSPYNLVTFSEDFTNAAWTKSNTSISANTSTAPNGTLTADTFTADGSNSAKGLLQTGVSTLVNGQTYTTSIYAKRGTNNFIQIVGSTAPYINLNVFANFNLLTGVVGTVGAGSTASITDVGNGWYRCTMTATALATTSTNTFIVQLVTSATAARGESNTLSTNVILWGAQLVEGTSALDYFPTTDRQDVPRIDFRNADGTLSSCGRLLLEPQRTNSIRNSSGVGAVVGSPGTLPTNWAQSGGGGLTRTIVGTGTENGLAYVDFRYVGTATQANIIIIYETNTGITASSGQTWAGSFYIKSIASSPNSFRSVIIEYTAVGTYVTDTTGIITVSSNLARVDQIRTISSATTARIVNGVQCNLTIGAAYDFTIRIAAPQMELGAYATTFIPTTTAAVTRIKDDAQKTGVSSIIGQSAGTIFWDITDLTGTPANTGNPDFGIRNTAFTNWVGITTNSFASPFRIVVRPTSGTIIDYTANITTAKAAVAWSSAGAVLYVNGVQVATSAVNPNFSFGTIQMLGGIISYKTNQAALFPTRFTNAQLAQLTTL